MTTEADGVTEDALEPQRDSQESGPGSAVDARDESDHDPLQDSAETESLAALEEAADEEAAPAELDAPAELVQAELAPALASEELPQVLEALLLASQSPLSMAQLKDLTGVSADALAGALTLLSEHYAEGASGIVLAEVANGWMLRTGTRQQVYVRKLLGVKPQRLTRAALETLALVAYRQPVTRPEMEDIRGVDCGAVLKALLERKMVKILGKKEEPGRPLLYGTTKEFLEFFNLKGLTGLPTLREFHELSEESRSIVEQETGEASGPPPSVEGMAALADGALAARLDETAGESADALADLEAAMAEAELRANRMAAQLNPAAEDELSLEVGSRKGQRPLPKDQEGDALLN